jgi:formylglycine-generating enzyme required for sulfatase activity
MMLLKGGRFAMGSDAGDADEKPVHRVQLESFYLDEHEVTVNEYGRCVTAGACEEPRADSGGRGKGAYNWGKPDRGSHPINGVSWAAAQAYCRWAAKRLPTEAEWEFAARSGGQHRTVPWGSTVPSRHLVNACGPECASSGLASLGDNTTTLYRTADSWPSTAPVCETPRGTTEQGLCDMAGNVWEWTADWYGAYGGSATSSPMGPRRGVARVYRGGGWNSAHSFELRTTTRYWSKPTARFDSVGFRCARGLEQ